MATKTESAREQIKKQFDEAIQTAKTLRDEIRVELHLASLDAQDRWRKIEPGLADAEKFGSDVSEAAKTAAQQVVKSFREFRTALKRHSDQG